MRTIPQNQKLLDLIDDARQGKIALPQFQRNFVWARDDITSLLVSILQSHFIGSFLLLGADMDHLPFAARALQGVDLPETMLKPYALVLDGQQRMTSLHYAFAAPNIPLRWTTHPYRFFIDLNKVVVGDMENAITSYRWIDCDGMLDRQRQFEMLIIPLTELEGWNTWQNAYEQWLIKKDQQYFTTTYMNEIRPAWTDMIQRLQTYLVPTITIPQIDPNNQESLAEVCAIFEKINSTGVKLSVYDLLTARLYKDKIDLHKLWEKAVEEHHLLKQYSEGTPDEFGVYVLRTISLLRGFDVKSKTLINLSPHNFEADWKTAVAYIEKALHRMTHVGTDGFGAFDRKWMPYVTMVTTLAAMLHAIDKRKLVDHHAYGLMQRWYWSSVFRERYAGAVESVISRDYQDFLKAVEDPQYEPEAISDARISICENQAYTLTGVSRLNSIYRGVFCLTALRGAKDFITGDSIQFHELEDHHIFPANYLQKMHTSDGKKLSNDRINCVVNRTLISDQTNRKITNSSPYKYLTDLVPANKRSDIMPTHFIESAAETAMFENDYEGFTRARDRMLVTEIIKRISRY